LRGGFFSSRFPLAFCSAIIALSASIDDDEVEAVVCLFDELDMMETGPSWWPIEFFDGLLLSTTSAKSLNPVSSFLWKYFESSII
jgi:hypothetical protein